MRLAAFSVAVFLTGVQVLPCPAHAAETFQRLPSNFCDVSSGSGDDKCSSLGQVKTDGAVIVNDPGAPIVASRSMGHSSADSPIDAYGYCRYVNNNFDSPILVPYRTKDEWLSFINHHPDKVELVHCSRGGTVLIPPNFGSDQRANQCASNPAAQAVTVPYKPYPPAATLTKDAPRPFSCQSSDGTAFSETAVAQLEGIDSAVGEPNAGVVGWKINDVLYTYDGVCGDMNGTQGQTAPGGTSLCHVGVASDVTSTTSNGVPVWAWTCSGGNGGGNIASCSMTQAVDGKCGNASSKDLAASSVAPNLLCALGTPSTVQTSISPTTAQPMWTWTCAPSDPEGKTANCKVLQGSVTLTLAPKQCSGRAVAPVDLSILVDASGSMQTLVDAARDSFGKVLGLISKTANASYNVVMFGGSGPYKYEQTTPEMKLQGNCFYGALSSFGHPSAADITQKLGSTTAIYSTPIARTMEYAASTFLTAQDHKRALIVLSDGLETCQDYGSNKNIVPTITQLQSQGIYVYGIMFKRVNMPQYDYNDGVTNFEAMDAYNTVSERSLLLGFDRFTPALSGILNEAQMTTCNVTARVYTGGRGSKFVGQLDDKTKLYVLPGQYTVVYSLCGNGDQAFVSVSQDTTLSTRLRCP